MTAPQSDSSRIFLRFYTDAIRSGLIADLGADRLQTLLVIASYMDHTGRCYPTQWAIAEGLSVARETANRRVKALLSYRWRGEPLVTAEKQKRTDKQHWANVVYTVRTDAVVSIF
ncbi:helix-turn-helix domain-containing protein [Paenibacillus pinihumi]|uniref:helix-turn-helix domain-containing protein n=1 Tax=Paenibacillus pinihumi TaxID=669462 RepID=UPI00048BE32C|nr:hypothetical protein [Paenibacillus pinihumi]